MRNIISDEAEIKLPQYYLLKCHTAVVSHLGSQSGDINDYDCITVTHLLRALLNFSLPFDEKCNKRGTLSGVNINILVNTILNFSSTLTK